MSRRALVLVAAVLVALLAFLWARFGPRPASSALEGVDFTPAWHPCATLAPPTPLAAGACAGEPFAPRDEACPYAAGGPDDLGRLFELGRRCVRAGEVAIPSGRIAVADGLVTDGPGPIDVEVAPGRYALWLSIVDDPAWGERNAAALLVLGPGRPARWRSAHDPDGGEAAFAVDSGTSVIVDLTGFCRLAFHQDPEWSPDRLEADGLFGAESFDRCADRRSGANAIVFRSGLGDGVYPARVGVDETGTPLAVAIDFGVVDAGGGTHPFLEGDALDEDTP